MIIDHSSKKGSALLISLFIVATLGAVAFGSTKVFISEVKTTSRFANTIGAYYAAEGALEKGLYENLKNPNSQEKTFKTVFSHAGTGNLDYSVKSEYKSIYEKDISEHKCKDTASYCELKQDETGQIILPGGLSSPITLKWISPQPVNLKITETNRDVLGGGASTENQYETISSVREKTFNPPISSNHQKIIRFRPVGSGNNIFKYYFTGPPNTIIDSGEMTIDGLGQYNQTKRQLQAVIDRSTGGVSSVFDYTLFSKQDL